jgi:hypothetical protein
VAVEAVAGAEIGVSVIGRHGDIVCAECEGAVLRERSDRAIRADRQCTRRIDLRRSGGAGKPSIGVDRAVDRMDRSSVCERRGQSQRPSVVRGEGAVIGDGPAALADIKRLTRYVRQHRSTGTVD